MWNFVTMLTSPEKQLDATFTTKERILPVLWAKAGHNVTGLCLKFLTPKKRTVAETATDIPRVTKNDQRRVRELMNREKRLTDNIKSKR